MFKEIAEIVKSVVFLARDTSDNKEAIEELRCEVAALSSSVRELSFKVREFEGREQIQREKLVLEIENALLRAKRLPSPRKKGK